MTTVGTAIDMALKWCLGVELQLDRVAQAESDVFATTYDRTLIGTEDGQRRFVRLRVDTHLLLVSARNLLRALADLAGVAPASGVAPMPATLAAHITTLRNCFEHWDERETAHQRTGTKGRAWRDFADDYPDEDAESYVFGGGETKVGGLDLAAVRSATGAVAADLRRANARPTLGRGSNSATPSAGP